MILTDEEIYEITMSTGAQPINSEFVRYVEAAVLQKLSEQEPTCYAVIEPSGFVNFTEGWPEACQEHINDAINEHSLLEAVYWEVIKLYKHPAPPPEAK